MPSPVALDGVALASPWPLRASVEGLRIGGRDLHPEQVEAILRALESPLAVLTGGAGVGKTTVTRVIADTWEHQAGGRVVLCALAGKAALRLSQATGRPAMTMARLIHQLRERAEIDRQLAGDDLDAAEADRLNRRRASLAQITLHTLVIVDEASMVDLASLYSLVTHMPDGARLLLVGDEGQLPPVSFGIVFHRLVLDPAISARLTVVHRQREEGGIPAVSRAIRDRRVPILPDYAGYGEGVSIRRCAEEDLAREVEAVWQYLGGLAGDTLIVTPTWKGVAGVEELNERLQRLNAAEAPVLKGYFGQWFSVGDPVMWTRNDYKRGLFNRLMGRVVAIDLARRIHDGGLEGAAGVA
jgi:exodeoxyribonuclease V alpha subunit